MKYHTKNPFVDVDTQTVNENNIRKDLDPITLLSTIILLQVFIYGDLP